MSGISKDRELESYWACNSWYNEEDTPEEPTIGEAYDAGYKHGKEWQEKSLKDKNEMVANLREHITAIYDLTGGWYGG